MRRRPARVVLARGEVGHDAARLVQNPTGFHVLRLLQIGVHEIVKGMHAIVRVPSILFCRGRHEIALNRLRPHAQQHVDVRGHVQRVGHGRRELRVAAGGGQSARGERRVVVAVDHVVSGAGMVGRRGEDLLGDLRRAFLARIGLVVRIGRGLKRQRVEGHDLAIVRIALRHLLHQLAVCERARAVIELVRVLEERLRGRDEVALARRLGARGCRLLDGLPSPLERRRRRRRPDLRPAAQGQAPVGHRAVGVGLSDGRKRLRRLEVPERVQERDGPLERLLHGRAARDREPHLPDLLRLVRSDGRADDSGDHESNQRRAPRHGVCLLNGILWPAGSPPDDRSG